MGGYRWSDFVGSCLTLQPEQRIGMVRAWPSIKEWKSDSWGQNVIIKPEEAGKKGISPAIGRFSGKRRCYDFSKVEPYIRKAFNLRVEVLPVFEPEIDDLVSEGGESWKDCVYEQVRYFNDGEFKKNPILYWQAGNEVNCIEYFNPDRIDLDKEDHWKYFNSPANATKYVELFLAPTIEAIRQASLDIYGDKNRIKVIVGSTANTGDPKSIEWLESALNKEIEGKRASTLRNTRVYENANIISLHYVMGASKKRQGHVREWNEILDYMYNRWVTTKKVEGMWLTEELGGRRNFIGVDIIVITFRYISWWMKHNWTPLRGGRCFLFGDWWDSDNAPPSGIIAEQLIGDYLKDGTLTDWADNLQISGKLEGIEAHCLKSSLPEGENFIIPIFSKEYVPAKDAPSPPGIFISEIRLSGTSACKNRPDIAVKIVTTRTVKDCDFKTFYEDNSVGVKIENSCDDPRSVFLVFISFAGKKDGFGYAFKKAEEIYKTEKNKVLSERSEILSLHNANWVGEDWFIGGADEDMAGDKHALVTRYAEDKPSMEVRLENDYTEYKSIRVEIDYGHCGGAKGPATLFWDGKPLVNVHPKEQEKLQKHRQTAVIDTAGFNLIPGRHKLEIEAKPGPREGDPYWFAVDSMKIEGV